MLKTMKRLFFFFCMMLSARAIAEPEPISIVLKTIGRWPDTRPDLPIWLDITVAGGTADGARSLTLQASSDLQDWQPVFDLYPRLPSFRVSDAATFRGAEPPLFYRAVSPATLPDEMFRKWTNSSPAQYRYKLTAVDGMGLRPFAGIITVSEGKVIEVTTFNDVPVPRQDLYKFKTIDELFGIIFSEGPRAHVVTVQYDQDRHFPLAIYVNYHQENRDADWYYQASDFESLSGNNLVAGHLSPPVAAPVGTRGVARLLPDANCASRF
jgi:hypothetical protein